MEISSSFSRQLKTKYVIALNVIMGIYTLKVLWDLTARFRNGFSLNASFLFGDFLINYQGGFVRIYVPHNSESALSCLWAFFVLSALLLLYFFLSSNSTKTRYVGGCYLSTIVLPTWMLLGKTIFL